MAGKFEEETCFTSTNPIIITLYLRMKTIFESAEDVAIDVPCLGVYLGDLLAQFVHENFSIEFLKELCEPIMGTSLCSDFIVQLLHSASNRLVSI